MNLRHWVLALGLCASLSAEADFDATMATYEKGDFVTAQREFATLAQLGHPGAQFNLGVMYMKGEGLPVDAKQAYSWFSLANANGFPNADKAMRIMRKRAGEAEQAALETSAHQLMENYGSAALKKSLLPEPSEQWNDNSPRVVSSVAADYPGKAKELGWQGFVIIEYDVAEDGSPRNRRVVEAVPKDIFETYAMRALAKWRFQPQEGQSLPYHGDRILFRFMFSDPVSEAANPTPETGSHLKKAITARDSFAERFGMKIYNRAKEGEPYMQYMYGLISPESDVLPDNTPINWFVPAAQAGVAQAQYELGKALLRGEGCVIDRTKALRWLSLAASQGFTPAQYRLAQELLGDDKADEAMTWLEKAAAGGMMVAARDLAWLLATHPDATHRNGKRGVELADGALNGLRGRVEPTLWEAAAAAYAETGNFEQAVRLEKNAIDEAGSQGWDTLKMQTRLAAYHAKKPWRSDASDRLLL